MSLGVVDIFFVSRFEPVPGPEQPREDAPASHDQAHVDRVALQVQVHLHDTVEDLTFYVSRRVTVTHHHKNTEVIIVIVILVIVIIVIVIVVVCSFFFVLLFGCVYYCCLLLLFVWLAV